MAPQGEIRRLEAQDFNLANMMEAEEAGEQLGDQGGCRRTADSKAKGKHEQEVEPDIDDGGGGHGQQGRSAIPQRAQDGGEEVV